MSHRTNNTAGRAFVSNLLATLSRFFGQGNPAFWPRTFRRIKTRLSNSCALRVLQWMRNVASGCMATVDFYAVNLQPPGDGSLGVVWQVAVRRESFTIRAPRVHGGLRKRLAAFTAESALVTSRIAVAKNIRVMAGFCNQSFSLD
jgi:hypothetical protein